jgi:hypothetical protein
MNEVEQNVVICQWRAISYLPMTSGSIIVTYISFDFDIIRLISIKKEFIKYKLKHQENILSLSSIIK